MLTIVDETGVHPDDPLYRAVIQCSDPEVTAWAWATGTELGLPSEEIVRDDEYGGDCETIRLALQMRAWKYMDSLTLVSVRSESVTVSLHGRACIFGRKNLDFRSPSPLESKGQDLI